MKDLETEQKDNGKIKHTYAGYLNPEFARFVAAILASLATVLGYKSVYDPREDPFRGRDATILEKELRIDIENLCARAERKLGRHTDAIERNFRKLYSDSPPLDVDNDWDCQRYGYKQDD